MKSFFLWRKSQINNYYRAKDLFEKVVKCPVNMICMLSFHVQNGSTIFQNMIQMYKHLVQNKLNYFRV